MLSAAGSPLVAGGASPNPMATKQPQTLWVEATRAFMRDGKPVAIGTVLEVPYIVGVELLATNKARRSQAPEPPKSHTITMQSAAAPKAAASTKGV